MNFYLLKNIFKDTLNKYSDEFKTVFLNIKDAIKDNVELKHIFLKYYNKEKLTTEDNIVLKEVLKNNLKVVGLGGLSILSFPIPGSTFLIVFIIKGAEKLGINLLPDREEVIKHIDEELEDVIETKKIKESIDSENLVKIDKWTQYDWKLLQQEVIRDCFKPLNIDLDIIPVKTTKSKQFAAKCITKINREYNKLVAVDTHYRFNVNINWDRQKLKNVMAHEMIHYYFFNIGNFKEGHGYGFSSLMRKINNLNIGYTVTLKDDEFNLKEELVDVMGLYLYVINKSNGTISLTSSSRDYIDFIKNYPKFDWYKNTYNYKEIKIYQITKGMETKYGIPNKRKFGTYTFKDNKILDNILSTSKYIETIQL